MTRPALLAAALLLSGCGALAPEYEVLPIEIYDAARYARDVDVCVAFAKAYKPRSDLRSGAGEVVSGATSNSSMIPISPFVPAYGAAGGLLRAFSDGFDVASRSHYNVAKNCLRDMTAIDRSAVVANPD